MKTETINIEKSRKIKDNVILVLGALVLASFFSFLFYRQAIMHNEEYLSDVPTEIYVALNNYTNNLLLILINSLLQLTPGFLYTIGLLEGLIQGFSWACTSVFINKYTRMSRPKSMMISLGLLFLTNIPIPWLFPRFYAGSLIAQPWHNITYIAMKPFAVLTLYNFFELYRIYSEEKRISTKHWILTMVMMALATNMNAGFMMTFGIVFTALLIIDLAKKRNNAENVLIMALTMVPALVLLFSQYAINCMSVADKPYRLVFGPSMYFFMEGIKAFVMKFVTGLAFPVLVFAYNRKKHPKYALLEAVSFLVGLIEAMFIVENGARAGNGSFLWGMQFFGFMLYAYAVPQLFDNIKAILHKPKKEKREKEEKERLYMIVCLLLVLAHIVSGLYYFYRLMQGNYFYI